MRRKGFRIAAGFLLVSCVLSGCGTPMYELTDEEETVIVRYAAFVLAKHNIYQKDGMVAVNKELLEAGDAAPDEPAQQPDEPDTGQEQEPEQRPQGSGADSSGERLDAISLAEAVGYGGQLNITYTGYAVTDNYQEGKIFSLDAHSGYDFIVAKFTMENIAGESLDVNVMRQNVTFRMSYDGSKWVKEDVTVLLTDLSTYTGTLGIGESVDLVLLFEVPEEKSKTIETIAFSVVSKDGEYLISQ